jgi:hypothetical protein
MDETVACALAPISDGGGTEVARQVDRPPYLVRVAWRRIDRTSTCGGTRAISADVRRGQYPLVRVVQVHVQALPAGHGVSSAPAHVLLLLLRAPVNSDADHRVDVSPLL